VPLDDVIAFMAEALSKDWCSQEETGSFSSAAGGHLAKSIDNNDLFEEIGFVVSNQVLMGDIRYYFASRTWLIIISRAIRRKTFLGTGGCGSPCR
jgi:hypothetical protein